MTRRHLVNLATRALGTAAGQEFFAAWMQTSENAHAHARSAPPEPDRWTNYKPAFFSPAEFAILQSFTEILLPTDDTPGAREAHVAHYIDFVVNASIEYAPKTQDEWRQAMDWLRSQNFGELSNQQRVALIERNQSHPAFKLIKQSAVFAFYTSRAGLIENLEYKGNAYLTDFPACTHPEHRSV